MLLCVCRVRVHTRQGTLRESKNYGGDEVYDSKQPSPGHRGCRHLDVPCGLPDQRPSSPREFFLFPSRYSLSHTVPFPFHWYIKCVHVVTMGQSTKERQRTNKNMLAAPIAPWQD